MSKTSLKAVLIGAGRMGVAHAEALRQAGITLQAVCDIKAESLEAFGARFKIPSDQCYTDVASFFAKWTGVDLVVIATTADSHCAFVCSAAKAKAKMIFCEKPMAVSVHEAEKMIAVCNLSGSRLAINHQMRFMDQYRLVRDVIDSGALGRLASMSVVAGCFGLSMNGSHYVEAFHFLTGKWPSRVTGWFSGAPLANPRGVQFADQAGDFFFLADSGERLSFAIGHDQGHGMTVTYAGSYGHIFVDELAAQAIITTRQEDQRDMPATRYGMPWDRQILDFAQSDNIGPTKAVLEALLSGENYPDGNHGLQVIRAIAACYMSAEEGLRDVALSDVEVGKEFPWA